MKTNNKDLRNIFIWVYSIYEEAKKLLQDSASHLNSKHRLREVQSTLSRMSEGENYDYIFAQYLLPPEETVKRIVILNGISFIEDEGENYPRLILGKIMLKSGLNSGMLKKGLEKEIGKSGLYLYHACVGLEWEAFKVEQEDKHKIFLIVKPTSLYKSWFEKRKRVKEVVSTWVPLASIDSPDTLNTLLDSAVPFFLKDEREELRKKVIELRNKGM